MSTASRLEKHRIKWASHGFKNLLVWLFGYLLLGPFLGSAPQAHMVMTVLLTAVLFSAVYATNWQSRLFAPSLAWLAVTLVLFWLNALKVLNWPAAVSSGLLAVYLGILVYSFAGHLFAARRVDGNVIAAALCLYLMLGMMWGSIFGILESLRPGSYGGTLLAEAGSPERVLDRLMYFSFVTLSTLGYGDITPQSPQAAALCQAEAILGQFFALVLVARLVGIQVAQEGAKEDRPADSPPVQPPVARDSSQALQSLATHPHDGRR
ncbi:MAG: Ion channel protein [Verrucomicrobiae bacterium]|nr:Ion channel protein [Verrucomicrobiae bacterium]